MNILYLKLRILFVAMIFINYCAIGQFTLEHILPNLSDQKLKAQDLSTIHISSQYADPTTGFKHVYLEQQYKGIPIYPIQMSLHFDAHNQLMHKSGFLVSDIDSKIQTSRSQYSTIECVQVVIKSKQNVGTISPKVSRLAQKDQWETYLITEFNQDEIKSRPSFYVQEQLIKQAVQIFWKRKNSAEWWNVFVDPVNGSILEEHNQMLSCDLSHRSFEQKSLFSKDESSQTTALSNSCYRVYPIPVESPNHGSRSLVMTPWLKAPNASPFGWHSDGQFNYRSSQGNNVDAYEDMDNNDMPTGGDAARAVGGSALNFDFTYNPANAPAQNKNAAITNLFYWNNVMHDVWYQYGFTEAAGNFQYNNVNRGGQDLDNVIAEGIDYIDGARNNANFGTPVDGYPPQMQMYVWQTPTFDTAIIESPSNIAGKIMFVPAAIGPVIKAPISSDLILANDGSSNPSLGCNNYVNASAVNGKIALVDRGICSYISKISKAQSAGAIALVICNNDPTEPFVIGGFSSGVNIPVVMIRESDCVKIKMELSRGVKLTLLPSSSYKFVVNNTSYIFSRAGFGPQIPTYLKASNVLAYDAVGNFNDVCQPIVNGSAINGKIAFVDDGNCDISFKAYKAQLEGAVATAVCKTTAGYPDPIPSGGYGQLVTIPVIELSQSDCQKIKNGLPSFGELSNTFPALADGNFDGGIISHEYGHGISNRLTGGPNNVNCLSNAEQAGEGWSDYFGLAMTMKITDYAYQNRGLATWSSGHAPSGMGIRNTPYNVDLNINPANYNQMPDVYHITQPHGIGYIWCSMIWDMTWALITQYGMEPDIYKSNSSAGNIKAFKLVMEGLKLQVCSPGFVDSRNAILKADTLLYGGANSCIIWNVFARRGLGYSANQGSSFRRDDGVSASNLPPGCLQMSEFQLFGLRPLGLNDVVLFAEAQTDHIGLSWNVESAVEMQSMRLLKRYKSLDREAIDTIALNAQSNPLQYLDYAIVPNQDYHYQLQIIDSNQELLTSNWATAKIGSAKHSDWTLYPNPVSNELKIVSNLRDIQSISIQLYNLQKQQLDENHFVVHPHDVIRLNTSLLIPGIYIVAIRSGERVEYLKFVKG